MESDTILFFSDSLNPVILKNITTLTQQHIGKKTRTLVSVVIGNKVTKIDDRCFENCIKLSYINIPLNVLSLGKYCFSLCISLNKIVLNEGITTIGENCFKGCFNLKTITIPTTIETIKDEVFQNCSKLIEITFLNSNNLKFLGINMLDGISEAINIIFYNIKDACSANTTSQKIMIENSKKLKFNEQHHQFIQSSFENINITNQKETILFKDNSIVTAIIYYSDSTTKTLYDTFEINQQNLLDSTQTNDKIIKVKLGEKVTKLLANCFQNCSNMQELLINNNIKHIENNCFENCINLKKIYIDTIDSNSRTYGINKGFIMPLSLLTLGDNCFKSCIGLQYFYAVESKFLISYPNNCFQDCNNLRIVNMSYNVYSIGDECFLNCSSFNLFSLNNSSNIIPMNKISIGKITIPINVRHIGVRCFKNCSSILDVTIPVSTDIISEECFYGCINLKNVTLHEKLLKINNNCFAGCSNLNDINITSQVSFIGEGAFSGCSKLNNLIFVNANSLTTCNNIFVNTNFNSLSNPITITLGKIKSPDNISLTSAISSLIQQNPTQPDINSQYYIYSISESTKFSISGQSDILYDFSILSKNNLSNEEILKCINSNSVKIAEYTTEIDTNFFTGYDNLSEIIIPTNVSQIGDSCFSNCANLINVKINDMSKLSAIPANCFNGSNNLNEITIPSNVTQIFNNAFRNCSSLKTLTILNPNNITSIDSNSISGSTTINTLIAYGCLQRSNINNEVNKLIGSNTKIIYPPKFTYIDNRIEYGSDLTLLNIPYKFGLREIEVTSSTNQIYSGFMNDFINLRIADMRLSNITEFNSNIFNNCINLTTINFPQTLTKLNINSFIGCINLRTLDLSNTKIKILNKNLFASNNIITEIIFPQTLETIDESCFMNCSQLTRINLLNTNLKQINANAFRGCVNVSLITVPNTLTSILSGAFSELRNLTQIDLLNTSVKQILNGVFENCSSLTECTFPTSLTKIFNNAFLNCSSLIHYALDTTRITSFDFGLFKNNNTIRSIDLPLTLTAILGECFMNCSNLTNINLLNTRIKILPNSCFYGCVRLQSITFPNILEIINTNCFKDCTTLTGINLSSTVVNTLGISCFHNCTALTQVILSTAINIIDQYAFYGCSNIIHINFFYAINCSIIKQYAFYGCSKLLEITLQNSTKLTSIENNCFSNNLSLTEVSLPNNIVSLGAQTFLGCTNLPSINLSNTNILILDGKCFSGCSNLTQIILPNVVTGIYQECFANCRFNTITFPESLKNIGEKAFLNCTNLRIITINDILSLNVCDITAFSGCNTLTFYIDGISQRLAPYNPKVKQIAAANPGTPAITSNNYRFGSSNFYYSDGTNDIIFNELIQTNLIQNIDKLTKVTLSKGVTEISRNCFKNCVNLSIINIPIGIITIGDNAFENCINLENIIIPSRLETNELNTSDYSPTGNIIITGLTAIPKNCFKGCSKLNQLQVIQPSLLTKFEESAFESCNFTSLIIPSTISRIRANCFKGCNNLNTIIFENINNLIECDVSIFTNISHSITIIFSRLESFTDITSNQINNLLNANPYRPTRESIYYVFTVNTFYYNDRRTPTQTTDEIEIYTIPGDITKLVNFKLNILANKLGNDLFKDSLIENIIIPNNILTIERSCFNGAMQLKNIILPEKLKLIDYGVFFNCSKLQSIIIPSEVTELGNYCFGNCTGLNEIVFQNPLNLTTIDSNVFFKISPPLSRIVLNGLKDITELPNDSQIRSFFNSQVLRPENTTDFYKFFQRDTTLIFNDNTNQTIPGSITTLSSNLITQYKTKSSLIGIIIGAFVTTIDDNFFANTNVSEIIFPYNIKQIGEGCFTNCIKLRTLVFENPNEITSISISTIDSLINLINNNSISITVLCKRFTTRSSLNEPFLSFFNKTGSYNVILLDDARLNFTFEDFGTVVNYTSFSKIIRGTVIEQIQYLEGEGAIDIKISDTVTKLSDAAFEFISCTSILIPKSIGYIPSRCFENNTVIQNITLETGVESLGVKAFYGCQSLTNINIPITINDILEDCFGNCTNLTEINIPANVTSIPNRCFMNCIRLTNITGGINVVNIGSDAFNGCIALINLPSFSNVTFIGNTCFKNCNSLTQLIVPPNITKFNVTWINGCNNLSTINFGNINGFEGYNNFEVGIFENSRLSLCTLSNNLTYLNDRLFKNCYLLTQINIPMNATAIGNECFKDCVSLLTVTIPVNNRLRELNDDVFNGCRSLTSFELSAVPNIERIGNYCFYNCRALANSLAIPSNLNYIGNNAFENTYIRSIIGGNNRILTTFNFKAFKDCTQITSISIPSSIISVEESAFENCSSLATVTFSDVSKLTTIERNAFINCTSLTSIRLPPLIYKIGYDAFINCSELTSFTVNNALTDIPNNLFKGCTKLTAINFAASNLQYLSANMFNGCSAITVFTVPLSVKEIRDNCFSDCSNLTQITITNNVDTIGGSVFNNCIKLNKIIFTVPYAFITDVSYIVTNINTNRTANTPDNITVTLNNSIFGYECPFSKLIFNENAIGRFITNLKRICNVTVQNIPYAIENNRSILYYKYARTNRIVKYPTFLTDTNIVNNILYNSNQDIVNRTFNTTYTYNSTELPYALDNKKAYNLVVLILANNVTMISSNAFKESSIKIVDVSISNSHLTEIGDNAFRQSQLEYFTVPNGLTRLGNNCFDGTSIKNIAIENSQITYLNKYCFSNTQLTRITIPSTVTEIDEGCFEYCFSLTSITFSDTSSLTRIGKNAFQNCNLLTSINIALTSLLNNIDDYAFQNCNSLTTININFTNNSSLAVSTPLQSSSYRIGLGAFLNCKSLSSVNVAGNTASLLIDKSCFENCINLTSFAFPYLSTFIGDRAFYNAYSLLTFTCGAKLSSIGAEAFYNCKQLSQITITDTVSEINANAFNNCIENKSINLGATINSQLSNIGENCFKNNSKVTAITISNITNLNFVGFNIFNGIMIPLTVTFSSITQFEDIYNVAGKSFLARLPLGYTPVFNTDTTIYTKFVYKNGAVRNSAQSNINYPVYNQGWTGLGGKTNLHYVQLLNNNITRFEDNCFIDCSNFVGFPIITGTTGLPTLVTYIGNNCFKNCTSLTGINISTTNNISYIGENAFYECSALTSINLNVCSKITYLGPSAFANCSELTTIDLSNNINLTAILPYTFKGCSALTSITLPTSIVLISENAFYGCSALTTINISDLTSLTYLGPSAFANCINLTTIDLSNNTNLTAILPYTFKGCSNLTSVNLPTSIIQLEQEAFMDCITLGNININNLTNLIYLGVSIFENCSTLSISGFPNTLCYIDNNAFKASNISSTINITNIVIKTGVFRGCKGVDNITYNASIVNNKQELIILSDAVYQNSQLNVCDLSYVIYIGNNTFNSTNIDLCVFSKYINNIPDSTFADCNALKSVIIPSNVKTIGSNAFKNCKNLEQVYLPYSVETIGSNCFENCESLPTVEIPLMTSSIGDSAFINCKNLKNLIIGNYIVGESLMIDALREIYTYLFSALIYLFEYGNILNEYLLNDNNLKLINTLFEIKDKYNHYVNLLYNSSVKVFNYDQPLTNTTSETTTFSPKINILNSLNFTALARASANDPCISKNESFTISSNSVTLGTYVYDVPIQLDSDFFTYTHTPTTIATINIYNQTQPKIVNKYTITKQLNTTFISEYITSIQTLSRSQLVDITAADLTTLTTNYDYTKIETIFTNLNTQVTNITTFMDKFAIFMKYTQTNYDSFDEVTPIMYLNCLPIIEHFHNMINSDTFKYNGIDNKSASMNLTLTSVINTYKSKCNAIINPLNKIKLYSYNSLLTEISNNCFNGCTSLGNNNIKLTLPLGIQKLNRGCFGNSNVILRIPKNVKYLMDTCVTSDNITTIQFDNINGIETFGTTALTNPILIDMYNILDENEILVAQQQKISVFNNNRSLTNPNDSVLYTYNDGAYLYEIRTTIFDNFENIKIWLATLLDNNTNKEKYLNLCKYRYNNNLLPIKNVLKNKLVFIGNNIRTKINMLSKKIQVYNNLLLCLFQLIKETYNIIIQMKNAGYDKGIPTGENDEINNKYGKMENAKNELKDAINEYFDIAKASDASRNSMGKLFSGSGDMTTEEKIWASFQIILLTVQIALLIGLGPIGGLIDLVISFVTWLISVIYAAELDKADRKVSRRLNNFESQVNIFINSLINITNIENKLDRDSLIFNNIEVNFSLLAQELKTFKDEYFSDIMYIQDNYMSYNAYLSLYLSIDVIRVFIVEGNELKSNNINNLNDLLTSYDNDTNKMIEVCNKNIFYSDKIKVFFLTYNATYLSIKDKLITIYNAYNTTLNRFERIWFNSDVNDAKSIMIDLVKTSNSEASKYVDQLVYSDKQRKDQLREVILTTISLVFAAVSFVFQFTAIMTAGKKILSSIKGVKAGQQLTKGTETAVKVSSNTKTIAQRITDAGETFAKMKNEGKIVSTIFESSKNALTWGLTKFTTAGLHTAELQGLMYARIFATLKNTYSLSKVTTKFTYKAIDAYDPENLYTNIQYSNDSVNNSTNVNRSLPELITNNTNVNNNNNVNWSTFLNDEISIVQSFNNALNSQLTVFNGLFQKQTDSNEIRNIVKQTYTWTQNNLNELNDYDIELKKKLFMLLNSSLVNTLSPLLDTDINITAQPIKDVFEIKLNAIKENMYLSIALFNEMLIISSDVIEPYDSDRTNKLTLLNNKNKYLFYHKMIKPSLTNYINNIDTTVDEVVKDTKWKGVYRNVLKFHSHKLRASFKGRAIDYVIKSNEYNIELEQQITNIVYSFTSIINILNKIDNTLLKETDFDTKSFTYN